MGAVLNSTPDMGDWAVEVRRESAYLVYASPAYADWNLGDAAAPDGATGLHALGDGGFGFPVGQLGLVTAATELILSHAAYRSWAASTTAAAPRWRVDLDGGTVRVHGPVRVYGDGPAVTPVYCVELEYAGLAVLAVLLEATLATPWRSAMRAEEAARRHLAQRFGDDHQKRWTTEANAPLVSARDMLTAFLTVTLPDTYRPAHLLGMQPDRADALAATHMVLADWREAAAREAAVVRAAVGLGVSWEEIARALDTTTEHLQRRLRHRGERPETWPVTGNDAGPVTDRAGGEDTAPR